MKDKVKIETRVWENSILIGRRVRYISEKFNVIISKVTRGLKASDDIDLIIEEADYIAFTGSPENCLQLLKKTYSDLKEVK